LRRWFRGLRGRVTLFFRKSSSALISALGFALVIAGISLAQCRDYATLAAVLTGIGGSLLAAAIVFFLSPANDEFYQKFLALGITDAFPSRNAIEYGFWVQWLRRAQSNCTLFGIAHGEWCRDREFPDALADRLRHNVGVKMFFLNPNKPVAETRAKEDAVRKMKETIQNSIRFMWKLRSGLEEAPQRRLKLYVYDATPTCGATWIDSSMLVAHYLAGFPNLTSPALIVDWVSSGAGTPDLYSVYKENIEKIEKDFSTEITDTNVNEFAPSPV